MAALADTERLWRRVPPGQRTPDGAMTSAFRCENFCVHVASRTTRDAVVQKYPEDHLYEFTVRQVKDAGASEVDDTREDGDEEDHAIALPPEMTSKKSFAKKVKSIARRVWPPVEVASLSALTGPPAPNGVNHFNPE